MDDVKIVAVTNPFTTQSQIVNIPQQGTVADLLDMSGLEFYPGCNFRIFVNDQPCLPEMWEHQMVKAGDFITVRAIPAGGGGGGKNILRVVMAIAIVAAAWYAAPLLLSSFSMVDLTLVPGLTSAVQMGLTIGGFALMNALCPVPQPERVTGDPKLYSIEAASNTVSLWKPIPLLLGTLRIYPPFGALPFTEVHGENGKEQYLSALFCMGYGPMRCEQYKIGDTTFEDYQGTTDKIESYDLTFNTYAYDPLHPTVTDLKIFTNDIHETPLSEEITYPHDSVLVGGGEWFTHTTEDDHCEEISIDIEAVAGMYKLTSKGSKVLTHVDFEVQFKLHSVSSWANATIGVDLRTITAQNVVVQAADHYRTAARREEPAETMTGYRCTRILFDSLNGTYLVRSSGICQTASNALHDTPQSPAYTVQLCYVITSYNMSNVHSIDVTDTRVFDQDFCHITGLAPTIVNNTTVNIGAGTATMAPVISAKSSSTIRKTIVFKCASGRYDMRVRRLTKQPDPDNPNENTIQDSIYLTAIRSKTFTNPVKMSGLSLFEMRVHATDKINGTLNDFNCVATSICPDWDTTTGTWIERPTNNPASLLRYVLQNRGPSLFGPNKRPLANPRINLTELQEWHEYCVANNFAFNYYVTDQMSVKSICDLICAAGRSALAYKDGKYTIVTDKPKTDIVQHISPRNSWGFASTKAFVPEIHAFRIPFSNEDSDYKTDERRVFIDGYDETNATLYEELQIQGVTDYDSLWKHGRFHLAQLILRPEIYSLSMDIENLVCTRGDLVKVVHDVPRWGAGQARIKTVHTSGATVISVDIDDPLNVMYGIGYACRMRLSDGSSVLSNVTFPGESGDQSNIIFSPPLAIADSPAIGDLILFGSQGDESTDCLVKSIKPTSDLSATLELLDYSPACYTSDTEAIPPFNTHINIPIAAYFPTIQSVRSDLSIMFKGTDGKLHARMLVTFSHVANRDLHRINRIEGRYRIQGDSTWIYLYQIPAKASEVYITQVERGQTYELQFRYIFLDGKAGPWGPTTPRVHQILGLSETPPDVFFDHVNSTFSDILVHLEVLQQDASIYTNITYYEIRKDALFGDGNHIALLAPSIPYTSNLSLDITTDINSIDVYYIKAVDDIRNYSSSYDTISATVSTGEINIISLTANFAYRDCSIEWQVASLYTVDYFSLTIQTSSSGPLRRTISHLTSSSYVYTFEMNSDDAALASRDLYITLVAYNSLGQTSTMSVSAHNSVPAQVSLPTLAALINGLDVNWLPLGSDTEMYEVAFDRGPSPDFDNNPDVDLFVTNNQLTYIQGLTAVTYYVAVRAYDAFPDPGPWSAYASATPESLAITEYSMDYPMLHDIDWSVVAGAATWSGTGTLSFKTNSYSITGGSTTDPYIWWDLNDTPTTFHHSTTKPPLTLGIWFMAYFDASTGDLDVGIHSKIINGGIIEAGTILAEQIAASAVTADKIKVGAWQGTVDPNLSLLFHFDNSFKSTGGLSPLAHAGATLTSSNVWHGGSVIINAANLSYSHTMISTGSISMRVRFTTFSGSFTLLHLSPNLQIHVTGGNIYLQIGATNVCTISTATLSTSTWYCIQATWDFATHTWTFMVDNGLVTATNTITWQTPSGSLFLGTNSSGSNISNIMLDELRIDLIARSTDELMAWYKFNAPFVDPNSMGNQSGSVLITHNGIFIEGGSLTVTNPPWEGGSPTRQTKYFTTEPYTPYYIDDVWYRDTGTVWQCTTEKLSGSFNVGNWTQRTAATNANVTKLDGIETGANVTETRVAAGSGYANYVGGLAASTIASGAALANSWKNPTSTKITGAQIETGSITLNQIYSYGYTLTLAGGMIDVQTVDGFRVTSGSAGISNAGSLYFYAGGIGLSYYTRMYHSGGTSGTFYITTVGGFSPNFIINGFAAINIYGSNYISFNSDSTYIQRNLYIGNNITASNGVYIMDSTVDPTGIAGYSCLFSKNLSGSPVLYYRHGTGAVVRIAIV